MSSSNASSDYTDGEILAAYVGEYRKLESVSKQATDAMVQALTPPFKTSTRQCDPLREATVQCYRDHPDDVFLCRDSIQKFAQCSKAVYTSHVELVERFQVLREQHRQEQHAAAAPHLPQ